jgi:hypothetical protein
LVFGKIVHIGVNANFTSGHTAAAAYLIGATVAEKLIEEYNL